MKNCPQVTLADNPDQMVLVPLSLVLQIQRDCAYKELSHFDAED
jgi:hypothetical protein